MQTSRLLTHAEDLVHNLMQKRISTPNPTGWRQFVNVWKSINTNSSGEKKYCRCTVVHIEFYA